MKRSNLVILLIAVILSTACSQEGVEPATSQVSTIPDTPGKWTYFSFSTNTAVGQAAVGDTVAERQWRDRMDWDLAVSNGLIKTNGGKSGKGRGAIRIQGSTKFVEDSDTVLRSAN